MNNREFLFLYDATMCNPNGDPDRENEPRMDLATETNLVSDGRFKRYIRDYLIDLGKPIFVSMVGGQKVTPETRLTGFIESLETNKEKFDELVEFDKDDLGQLLEDLSQSLTLKEFTSHEIFKKRNSKIESKISKDNKKEKAEDDKLLKRLKKINNATLLALVRKEFLDIRYFGGAFAIGDFSKTITGPIQINTGYSLHPVKLHHEAIATLMSGKDSTEGHSNFGKKEKVVYSFIAFTGTINSRRADEVKLTDTDVEDFRSSLVPAIQYAATTDSKKNQYPKFYLEIEYKKNEIYGRLGDLRHHIEVKSNQKNSKDEMDYKLVRRIDHLDIDFSGLHKKINQIKDRIDSIKIWKAIGFETAFDESKLDSSIKVETLLW